MSKYLDLDDVAAGHPAAESELADLRREVEQHKKYAQSVKEAYSRVEAYVEMLIHKVEKAELENNLLANELQKLEDKYVKLLCKGTIFEHEEQP